MINKMKKRWTIIFIFLLVLTPTLLAADFDHVVSNSEDWRDVYSAMLFATLEDAEADFLVSTSHGQILLNGIGKERDMMVVTSKDKPFVFNYPSLIEAEGFAGGIISQASQKRLRGFGACHTLITRRNRSGKFHVICRTGEEFT